LLNIYSPIKTQDQCSFFSQVISTLDEADSVPSVQLIIGGDFNVHLEDSIGGRKEKKDSVKNITDIKLAYDLIDIRQIKNPKKRKFT